MKRSIIKNRAPAPIQITAEQILREAQDRKENVSRAPRRNIADKDELIEYRMTQRKQFEDTLRRQRQHIGTWIKYATWEEQQHEFERARSIFERALDVDYRNSSIWLKYAEMEMRNQFINHARNVWDRAVTLIPRVAQFWYKYAFMEEMVGNLPAARRIFERWMEWQPEDQAWYSYIKFEIRSQEIPRARALYERYITSHKSERSYLKYANWEEKQQHQIVLARCIYESAMEELRPDERTQLFYTGFASFEDRCQEFDRARAIYQYALDQLDREDATDLYHAFIQFEKKHGDKKRIEDVVVAKRRVHYERQVDANEFDYDAWIDYMKLEETQVAECHDNQREKRIDRIREIYERAIANVPPMKEKKYWRRYIYLWIKYAIFEELIVRNGKYNNPASGKDKESDEDRVKQVYTTCLALIPHDVFTFAKIWIMYAKYLVRLRDVQGARNVLGQGLGKCPKKKLFTSYIELELMMGEIERCRTIYEKFLLFDASDCDIWQKYATLEQQMGESERARGIYELAIQQPVLDMPEMIWKAYIDFEILNQEIEKARLLYERLLERTKHVKVWISFAQFECSRSKMAITDPSASPSEVTASRSIEAAREVFERAIRHLKEQQQLCLEDEANVPNSLLYEKKAERALCLETWLDMEQSVPDKDVKQIQKLLKMQPQKVTKQRMVYAEDGTELGLEEYTDFVFVDDEKAQNHMKLLLAAQKWKKTKLEDDIIIIQRASFSECLAIPRSAIASVKGPTSTKGDPVRPTLNIAVEDLKTFSPLHGRILGFDAIYGIIWLLRGPYLALVSDSKVISNNEIHKEIRQVMKLELLLIATYQNEAPLTPEQERDESRYLEMLTTNIDKLQLHFSFDSDLTHSLQRSSELKPFASSASHDDNYAAIAERADRRFCWNYIHCAAFFEKKLYKWITPLMQGFIEVTETIRVNRTAFKMIFISRRSCRRPGTRFTMRGIDENGNVANFVETEQICVFQDGRQTSFLQIRGSIPFHWSSPVNMKYAPPVYQRNRIEKDVEAFRKHAYELMQLYGRVILINLIDKKRHELQLGNALTKVIGTAANQDSHILATIRLVWFDFHQECRKMRYQNLVRLIQLVDDDFRNYGFFCRDADGSVTQTQSGVVRTNCMDNLDRTNVVQSLFGRRSLLIQLNEMEALQGDVLNTAFHDFESVFKRIWGNHADAISRLYAGTGALKTDFTRTGRRTKLGVIMDAYNSSLRYILNNFMDGYRQDVLDLLLGKYLVFRNAPSPFTSSQETAESVLKRVLSLTAVIFLYETTTSSAPLAALFEHLGKAIVWTALICSIYLFILMKKGHKHGERLVRLPRLRPRDGCTTHWKD